jgi:hypothetical protein
MKLAVWVDIPKISRASLLTLLVIFTFYSPQVQARNYAPHNGYLASVDGERDLVIEDLVIIPPPPPLGPPLRERIFNEKLSREFRDRYDEKFGRTEVEQVYNSNNRFTVYDETWGAGGTLQELSEERQKFGDYMLRRLLEYHVDSYAQNDPQVRVVWEAKERLSNINVEVRQFRFDMNYQLAGNTFDLKVVNPWVSTARVRLQMNPGSFGPGPVDETFISIGRPVSRKLAIESHYAVTDGVVSLIGRTPLTPALGASLTASTFTKSSGTSRRESLYLAGLSYRF